MTTATVRIPVTTSRRLMRAALFVVVAIVLTAGGFVAGHAGQGSGSSDRVVGPASAARIAVDNAQLCIPTGRPIGRC